MSGPNINLQICCGQCGWDFVDYLTEHMSLNQLNSQILIEIVLDLKFGNIPHLQVAVIFAMSFNSKNFKIHQGFTTEKIIS